MSKLRTMHSICTTIVSHQDEKLKMEQERECYKTEVEQLRGDLEVTRNESAKEGTKKSEMVFVVPMF